jgi:hypothetical protein
LHASTPKFTGTGQTRSIDSNQVVIIIWAGSTTSSTPLRFIAGPIGSDGHFSVQVADALDDGQYTAEAAQQGGGGVGYSSPVTFQIKVHAPALTLAAPAAGASVGRSNLAFAGNAGDAFGDSPTITVYLYRGTRASGRALGKVKVHVSGPTWSSGWPKSLRVGFYTARAVQSDDAGHTTRAGPHTFLLVPTSKTIGSILTLNHSGSVSVPVSCLASSGATCTGSVLVVTQGSFQTTPGGPTGPLEVLFANVQINGGTTQVVHGTAPGSVVSALSHMHSVPVQVTVKLSKSTGGAINVSAARTLKIT